MKECIICKKIYEPTGNNQKSCSFECRKVNIKNYSDSYEKSKQRITARELYYQTDKYKKSKKEYLRSNRFKEHKKKYLKTEKGIAASKKYYQSDSFKNSIRKYRSRDDIKTVLLIQRKQWLQTSAGKKYIKRFKLKRRALMNNIVEVFTIDDWNSKLINSKGICSGYNCVKHYVGVDKLYMDHWYPIAKANIDFKETGIKRIYTIDDIQPLCKSCNSKKKDKIIEPKGLNSPISYN